MNEALKRTKRYQLEKYFFNNATRTNHSINNHMINPKTIKHFVIIIH